MAGFGETELGLTPFGTGTADGTAAPPTTLPSTSRYVNFRTKDYEVADDGEYKRMPSVRHRVLMILSTTLDSAAALPGFGLKLPARIDKRYPQLADHAIRLALKPMVRAGELKIEKIEVTRSSVTGRVDHVVKFKDLTTGNPDTVTI